MRCFVAGGTGVLGRRAVPALVAGGHEVTVVARSPERDELVRSMGATPVRADLFDPDGLRTAASGHDAVINLATHIPPVTRAARKAAWEENDRIRREASANLADAARTAGASRFVQESITFPYADGGDGWIDESAARPMSPYSEPVEHAEAAADGITADGGTGVVLRFAHFHSADSSHIQTFAKAFRWRINPFLGDPDAYWSLIGVDAAGRAVAAAVEAPAGVYNVADDDPPTRRALGVTVAEAIGRKPPFHPPTGLVRRLNPDSEVLMRSHRIDNRRFQEATGWSPDHRGAEGLARSIVGARS